MKIHKDDTVVVITGKDKGKRGRVREVRVEAGRVIVEGINVMRKHTRGQRGARQAGIIEIEAPIQASNLMVFCPNCKKGVRVGHSYLADGSKVRACRKCNEPLDDPEKRWS